MLAQDRRLRLANFLLQTDEIDPRHRKDRGKALDRDRAAAVVWMRAGAGPANSDPQPAVLRHAFAPFGDAVFRRPDIGNRRRDGRKFGFERQRQTKQRTVQVELGQHLAAAEHLRDARNGCHQRGQRGPDPKQHLGAERRNHWCVTGELDGIAQTLLGDEKNGLARDLLFAAPHRPWIVGPLFGKLSSFPAVFVFLPAVAKIAEA